MASKLIRILEQLENPKFPLLGPNLKGLYWFGLWQTGNRIRNSFFIFVHFCAFSFVISEFIELYYMRNDLMNVLFNISVTALSLVSISKPIFFIFYLPYWKRLVINISTEEINQIQNNDPNIIKMITEYKTYSRILTYLFWSLTFLTNIVTITTPFLKYSTSSSYRESIRNGTEPYPQILSSWFPFDKTKMPGYYVAVTVHVIMIFQGAGVIAVYDSTLVAIMSFLKGQMIILRYKCETIFGYDEAIPRDKVLDNIKECHRLHNFFLEQYKTFNSIISPVMFIYVLVCSIMICCSVVQLSIGNIAAIQKLWVIEYSIALAIQLFLYCWHSNEIAVEVSWFGLSITSPTNQNFKVGLYVCCMLPVFRNIQVNHFLKPATNVINLMFYFFILKSNKVDRSVYASNWWRADVLVKRQVLLLAGKLAPTFILDAGPFATFSMATFIDIIKGSYSFYTLFTQMHENEK